MSAPAIVLASASPRRKELLASLGVRFVVDPATVDEASLQHSDPLQLAIRLAELKAKAVAERYVDGLVLGADTMVLIDGEVLNKPADAAQARSMLRRLSGRTHTVVSGVAVVDAATGRSEAAYETTQVTFLPLSDRVIDRYVATGEPLDKAGAYGIQGLGALLVARVEGCYPNVVGLPLVCTARLLERFGFHLL